MRMLWLFGVALAAVAAWAQTNLRREASASAEGLVLALDARIVWQEPDETFGGYSGIEILDGGRRALLISDRGTWATAALTRDTGRLTGASLVASGPLLGIDGEPLSGVDEDAEGLAVDAQGRAYISFEGFHRVRRYDRIDGPAEDIPSYPSFRKMQSNAGLEALAVDSEGALYAIQEGTGESNRPVPVYRFRNGRWDTTLHIRRQGRFLPVGADFGPDGALYLLERDFTWLGGFATRIRRFAQTRAGFGEGLTLLQTRTGELDNMEGISVWRDAGGVTRLTLIADDNFFLLQDTLLVEYRLLGL